MSTEIEGNVKEVGGGRVWTESKEAALDYLRARVPYQQYLIDTMFTYHEYSSKEQARWDAVLDLGCGPGQLGIHMSKKFKKVYGRDVSEKMIDIAKALPHMEDKYLDELGLFKPAPECQFDFCVAKEDDLKMPDDSVDAIVIGAAHHWFDWNTAKSSIRIWNEWSRVLRKNGSVMIVIGLAVPGNWFGSQAEKSRPLRKLILDLTVVKEVANYFKSQTFRIGPGSLSAALKMPWQIDANNDKWDSSSRLYLLFDFPTDVKLESREDISSDPIPNWMPLEIAKYVRTNPAYDGLEERWKTTTPKKMATWIRSLSGFVHYYRDHPHDKLLIVKDGDLAARVVRTACQEGGLDYDEIIELHHTNSLLALRRSP